MIQTSPLPLALKRGELLQGAFMLFSGILMTLLSSCIGGKKDVPIVVEPEVEEEPLPERFENDDLPKAADELFDDFFYYYATNASLQHRRTIFPLPVSNVDGEVTMMEDSAWTFDRFFMDQGMYVRIFDTQQQQDLPGDTTVDRVVVEKFLFEADSVRQYLFLRNDSRWQLHSISHQALKGNPNEQFLRFYYQFASDSAFQKKSLNKEIAFSGPDPDDDFAMMEGFITPDSWEAFAPELPRDSIYNIVYCQQDARSKKKSFVICGIANGMETVIMFQQKRGKWKLVRIEN